MGCIGARITAPAVTLHNDHESGTGAEYSSLTLENGMAKQTPDELKRQIVEVYKATGSVAATARKLDINLDTVRRWRDWVPADNPVSVPAQAAGSLKVEATPVDPVARSRLQRKVSELEKDKRELLHQVEEMQRLNELFQFVSDARLDVPKWTRRKPVASRKQAIACTLFSDWHLDEVVKPEQINYVNEFNREIAERRLENYFHNVIKLSQDYIQGLKYEGAVVCLSGDLFSGIIHQELRETNAATIFESLLYWAEPVCAGLKLLRDAFGRLYVPAVVGNHGRNQHKPHAKNRPQDNFDWFFAHLLRKLLANEKGIDFAVSDAADHAFAVFETRYLLTHGDQFRGGGGIAGLLSPLMIGDARKRKRESAVNRAYDYMLMGHWHQLAHFKGLIVNGSGKGYDEYAYISNFDYEPPQQAFWVTSPTHGKTIDAPIHVQDERERWKGAQTVPAMAVGFGGGR